MADWYNDPNTDPFAAVGGGVQIQGGTWVPKSHPLAQQAGAAASSPTTSGSGTATSSTPQSLSQQAAGASTTSSTPGAAPAQTTTNQGTQDVVRNSYLAQATQGTQIDRNDPNFRQQADAFSAGVERQRRNYVADQAEALGPYATGALRGQERMSAEKAGQAVGGFEAELVGRELAQRRSEIQAALEGLRGMVSTDQQAQLQRELAQLDAQMRALGINTGASTAASDLALREKLGIGGLNLDLLRLAQQQNQFADTLGFNVADREAYYNNLALQNLWQ